MSGMSLSGIAGESGPSPGGECGGVGGRDLGIAGERPDDRRRPPGGEPSRSRNVERRPPGVRPVGRIGDARGPRRAGEWCWRRGWTRTPFSFSIQECQVPPYGCCIPGRIGE